MPTPSLYILYQYKSGVPKDHWKVAQQTGRSGRDGRQAVSITLVWPGQIGIT